jgi:polyphosphate kinase 2 (PPK2 family)
VLQATLKRRNERHQSQVGERQFWDGCQGAYDAAIGRCSTAKAPWHIVPGNRNWYRNWAWYQVAIQTLEGMNLNYPDPNLDVEAPQRWFRQAA